MTRRERMRRVVLLCCNFARNLAYYRVGQSERDHSIHADWHPQASFWRQANTNFLDTCVLEWCKLLGDKKAEHHWSRVVSDAAAFEAGLLHHIGIDVDSFQKEIDSMRSYRDKFIAHLDSLPVMNIPMLDIAQASVWFYHGYVVGHEIAADDLTGLPDTMNKFIRGYEQCVDEATDVYLKQTRL